MNRVQERLLEEIMESENESELNEWERKFIDDLYNKSDRTLTTQQNHKLIEIHAGICWR
jgi:hypothetical protein